MCRTQIEGWSLIEDLLNRSTPHYRSLEMDGWMFCHFTSFSTLFQSYQEDERVIMKSYVQWNRSVYG